jgi:hypothetical protein
MHTAPSAEKKFTLKYGRHHPLKGKEYADGTICRKEIIFTLNIKSASD